MPSYPPRNHPVKKRQILEQKVFDFLSSLEKFDTSKKLKEKTEKVRKAKLNFIKASLAVNKSYCADDENEETKKLKEKLNKEFVI